MRKLQCLPPQWIRINLNIIWLLHFTHTQFEYQQAQLEAEIENLSWKIERAETTDRGDLENQMDIAEKRRVTLLKDFLEVNILCDLHIL